MKQNYLKQLMTVLLLLCCTAAGAADFEVDGICYNILSSEDKTVEVASRGIYSGAVTIPASVTYNSITYSVTSIGEWAFFGCDLTSIEIPSSVTSIGDYAFYKCYHLTSIEIPSSVTSIGDKAFYECYGLTSIEIPSSVTSIGNSVFLRCTGLTSIVVDEENTIYDSRGNCNAIIETASNTLIAGLKNTIIPEGVISIGDGAFFGCDLTSIEIPSSVTSIGEGAFSSCMYLTSIEIPSSVTSIGKWAFAHCTGLTSIVVDEGNTIYDSRNNSNAIIETASNTLIAGFKNTIIPEGVTSIGNSAFYHCYNLTSIEIPSSVTSIGNSAFYHCYNLTSIEIPSSVTSIGERAFRSCTGLTSITSHIAAEDLFTPGIYAFEGIDTNTCILYVPAGAKTTYATTSDWKEFKNIVEMSPAGYSLTVTAAGYATMYLDKAVEIPAGVEAYTANRVEGDLLKMQAVEDVIPANTAVIIKANEGTYSFAYSYETPEAISDNLLRGTVADTYVKPQ